MDALFKWLFDYLKGQPFNNVLIAALMGTIVFFNIKRAEETREAHGMVHTVIREIREENQQNQDRLIFAMKGVKYEVAKTTRAVKEVAEAVGSDGGITAAKQYESPPVPASKEPSEDGEP
jgi:hypothetical protein